MNNHVRSLRGELLEAAHRLFEAESQEELRRMQGLNKPERRTRELFHFLRMFNCANEWPPEDECVQAALDWLERCRTDLEALRTPKID